MTPEEVYVNGIISQMENAQLKRLMWQILERMEELDRIEHEALKDALFNQGSPPRPLKEDD